MTPESSPASSARFAPPPLQKEPLRVLVVHNRYRSGQPSGENSVVDEEVALLESYGCTVERLETSSDDIDDWGIAKKGLLPARIVWSQEGYRLTKRAIRRFAPDVVHFHNTFPVLSPSALWAARRSGAGIVQTLHNFRPLCPASTFFRDGRPCEDCLGRTPWPSVKHGCYRASRVRTLPIATSNLVHSSIRTWRRCVDLFLVPSEFAKSRYLAAGWPENQLYVKYNSVRAAAPPSTKPRSGFLSIGRLSAEKGIDILLDAWRLAHRAESQGLTVVGAGDDEAALRLASRDLPGVRFAGQLSSRPLGRLLADARELVVPSRCYEVFPRVIAEAYAVGTPVIAFQQGSLAELVQHEATGLLVTPRSASHLAEALARVALDDLLVRRLSEGAAKAYTTRFSPDRALSSQLSAYDAARAHRSHQRRRAH